MKNTPPRYLIGIDLGTTHTVVAFADLQNGADKAEPTLFEIEQLIAPGEVARRPLLPSFRYHPAPGELPEQQLVLPWRAQPLPGDDLLQVTGELARELGSRVEGRQIASAKSWLSHDKVDRSAAILPWAAAADVAKASPVVASASYLNHVRCAWNHEHPDQPLEQQVVVITVPASFDEAARALTLQAAEMAGYPDVTLLEEPQAVCYDWFYRQRETAAQQLQQSRLLFVVDVGGGTTDLSLIRVRTVNGQLQLDRIAVGDHLMLGGDNLDLALAHQAEQRISGEGRKLSAASLSQLIQQSRKAKELLLGEQGPETAKVTLLGSGARLIGGARSAEFSRAEVQALALDGFFPLIEFGEQPARRGSAVVEFGLPYAPDPAVSRYLSQFLSAHQNSCREALGLGAESLAIPDTLLFNGGVFNSVALKQRALDLLQKWRGAAVTELHNQHPDLAVAFGAVAFALAQRTSMLKIGGGSARSYFLQVQLASGASRGVCLLPKGTEEGAEIALDEHRFALRLNQPVQFHLAACSGDDAFSPGTLVDLDDDRFLPLPPLVAALDDGDAQQEIPVSLVTRLTEVGTLDIHCQSEADPGRRWKVEFQLRRDLQARHQKSALPPKFGDAIAAIDEVFGPGDKQADPNAVKRLRQTIEKLLGEREQWDTALARAVFDALWERSKRRRRSAQHERVWFNLAGYCLRPGFGYPADDWRISQIWALYVQGLQFNQENQSWAEWWTFWRRAAGGLDQAAQQRILRDIAKFLNPATARNLKIQQDIKNKSYEDMVRLAAALENLDLPTKTELGNWLLKRLEKSSETATSWWALGRIGAREPFHGSAHNVVPAAQAEKWLTLVQKQDWRKNQNAAFAAVMLARVSGDRTRDLQPSLRDQISTRLRAEKAPELWYRLVTEQLQLDETESRRVFGETLPAGLKLMSR